MVMGGNSCSKGRGFKSQCHLLVGHFFTLICCKNCNVCLKRRKFVIEGSNPIKNLLVKGSFRLVSGRCKCLLYDVAAT